MKNTQNNIKTKRGAASFYIVAFSTLILMVIATSFAMVAISEISRSSNDDLSQSAYDSALAGIEDAKVAYINYRKCKDAGNSDSVYDNTVGSVKCGDIISWVEEKPDCNMVGHILGKIKADENDLTEVKVGSVVNGQNVTNQAYTCVKIDTNVPDYRKTLSANDSRFMVNLQNGDASTNNVKKIRIKWYTPYNEKEKQRDVRFENYKGGKVVFPSSTYISAPPVVELQILQTAEEFRMSDFEKTVSEGGVYKTDRATLYLVPKEGSDDEGENNFISKVDVVKTNDRIASNKAFDVYCPKNPTTDFYCKVDIEMPEPIGEGLRRNDTFTLSVSLPYLQPNTDFAIELICDADDEQCAEPIGKTNSEESSATSDMVVRLKNSQISIDSTGRANDLYRRIETRLEGSDSSYDYSYNYLYYPLQVDGDEGVEKLLEVDYEGNYNFSPYKTDSKPIPAPIVEF